MPARITLLTDFGSADGYVAAMRGIIATRAPRAVIDEASHDIDPGDVRGAAIALDRYWRLYPTGTVHVVVVDPGVGSNRRAIVVASGGQFGVGPDNGVLEPMLSAAPLARVHHATNAALRMAAVSSTFHGRDVFAPVAAHLANGGAPDVVGPRINDALRLHTPTPVDAGSSVRGVVMHIDRFGNLITNIPASLAIGAREISVASHRVGPLRTTYADVQTGDALALIGSSGMLEISVRDGDAARVLDVPRDADVRIVK